MKLVSVDRALKVLQNDILFSSKLFCIGTLCSKIHFAVLGYRYRFFKGLYLYLQHFVALSTDTSFIELGVCYQKVSTLEFNSTTGSLAIV